MRMFFLRGGMILLLLLFLLSAGELGSAWDEGEENDIFAEMEWGEDYFDEVLVNTVFVRGKVVAVLEEEKISEEFTGQMVTNQKLKARLTSGEFSGEETILYNYGVSNPVYDLKVRKGDRILIGLDVEEGEIIQAYVVDHLRDFKVYTLVAFFFLLMLGFGWKKGAKDLCSLVLTLLLVWKVLIPGFLQGHNTILLTIAVSIVVVALTAFIDSGFTKRSLATLIGATGGLGVAGAVGLGIGRIAHLTGFRNGEAEMLQYIPYDFNLDIRGVLFAVVIISALGAVVEVSLRLSLAVEEAKRENPELETRDLVRFGMDAGRDIMGRVSRTLILACFGSSLPLLVILTAYGDTLGRIINLDMFASELVRSLAGAIGLILAVPLTALVAGAFYGAGASKKIETGKAATPS